MATILIVEDAAIQQTILQRFIQPNHTVVASAKTEREAVEHADKHEPDVVVMDITLAEGDGIRAATRIKSATPETKIIMSTALVSSEIKGLAYKIPTDAYLIKPYSKHELLETIEGILQ